MSEVILEGVEATWFGHEGVFVLAVFAHARFFSSRAWRHFVIGDGLQQIVVPLACLPAARRAPDGPLPLVESGPSCL